VSITTILNRQFNQHAGSALKAADKEPVTITDRGRPT
jgi:hypothetical protein